MNLSLFYFINQGLAAPWLDEAMKAVTFAGEHGWIFAIPWLALMIFGGAKGRRAGWAVLPLLLLTDWAAAKILKPFFEHPRPFLALPDVRLITPITTDISPYGFPSNHASNMFAISLFFSLVYPTLKIIAPLYSLALVVGFSRVYIGVHFPLDILGGLVWGSLCAVVIFNLLDIFHNRGSSPPAKAAKTK